MHIWSITSQRPVMMIRARVKNIADQTAITAAIKARLANQFDVSDVIVEITAPHRPVAIDKPVT